MAGDPGYSPDGTKALDVTGIFAVSCRHIFICPNGVVDFHKGEKYRYADMCFSGALNESYTAGLRYFVITYDIACKYGVNFKSRCCNNKCNFVLIPTAHGEINIIFCVNKFHQESHDDECAAKNALDYTKYVGRTCGEGVETVWAEMNWLRYSTKEMGTGTRIETLSEHFNHWNWQKTLGITRYLRGSYTKAVEALDNAIQELEGIETSIGPETASKLRLEYVTAGGEQFLQDNTQLQWQSRKDLLSMMQNLIPSPSPSGSMSTVARWRDVSHVNLIFKALKLETMQARLCQRAHDLGKIRRPIPTLKNRVKALENEVQLGINSHLELLFQVVPQLEHLRRSANSATDEILLPTRLTSEEILRYDIAGLLQTELLLRACHAYDLITEVKKALALRSWWSRHIGAQPQSQTTKNTRGQSCLQACRARVRETARAYKVCYNWLAETSPETAKRFGLQALVNTDLVLLSTWGERKGYKRPKDRLPWIWTLRPMEASDIIESTYEDVSTAGDNPEDTEGMEVEEDESKADSSRLEDLVENWRSEFVRLDFVHALAATERWTEEVHILTREMPATCRSFRHSALVWAQRANSRSPTTTDGQLVDGDGWFATEPSIRGYIAYASRQFDLYARLTSDAMREFSDVVGKKAWQEIWLSPREQNDPFSK
ncbi:hypothetical protein FRC01_010620 [Tulasnella sp. 417]|nr:hypothetical protein FRC01_010620 [Tulasnella sp. 417]